MAKTPVEANVIVRDLASARDAMDIDSEASATQLEADAVADRSATADLTEEKEPLKKHPIL